MHFDPTPSLEITKQLAAMRLLNHVANGTEIDPSLTYNTASEITDPYDKFESEGLPTNFRDILKNNEMLYGVEAGKKQNESSDPQDGDKFVGLTIYQFPTPDAAQTANSALEAADFSIAGDQNEKVQLEKYPEALTHWRPGIRTIGSRLTVGSYVLRVFTRAPKANLPDLKAQLQRIFDVQVPMLEKLPALSKREILHLPHDPEGVHRIAFAPDYLLDGPSLSVDASLTGHGAINMTGPFGEKLIEEGHVDAVGTRVVDGTTLWRSSDNAGADAVVEKFRQQVKQPIAPPKGVPDSFCDEADMSKEIFTDHRYRCVVRYRQYVARVSGPQIADAQQRAAAQYAILANSW